MPSWNRREFLRQAALAGTAASFAGGAEAAADPIKIGAPGNFTGSLATLDTPIVNGQALKVRELNAAGGLLGRTLQLVVVDMESNPKKTAPDVAQHLFEKEKVSAVVGFGDSDSVLALGPYVVQRGLPFITPGATSPKLPAQVSPVLFLACFGDNVQAAAGAQFLYETLGPKRVHVLHYAKRAYTRLLAGYFEASFKHLGGEVVYSASYDAFDAATLEQTAKTLAAAGPVDSIYLSATPDEAGLAIASLRAEGLSVPIVGGDGYDTPLLLEQAGATVSDIYYSNHLYLGNDPAPEVIGFMSRYWAAYGYGEVSAFAALGYDAMGLLIEAIAQLREIDPLRIIATLAGLRQFVGITGDISYFPGRRIPRKSVSMIAIDKGVQHLAKQFVPAWIPPP